jgi:hypothetical protein
VEEVWVKSCQDVWALARCDEQAQRRLLVVREKRKEGSLAAALGAIESLADDVAGGEL